MPRLTAERGRGCHMAPGHASFRHIPAYCVTPGICPYGVHQTQGSPPSTGCIKRQVPTWVAQVAARLETPRNEGACSVLAAATGVA